MRHEFSAPTKRSALKRAAGKCEGCSSPLQKGKYHFDHDIAEGLTRGRNSLENCKVLCVACHKTKTAQDKKVIAKAKRQEAVQLNTTADPPRQIKSRGFAPAPERPAKVSHLAGLPRRSLYVSER